MPEVHICEVGPRDGLQNAKHMMPTAAKKAWISALAAAGLKEIEVGSFVPPKLIPAMADTGEIVAHARTIPGLTVVALAPNLKGYQRAVEAGAHKVTFPVSASRAHSESNVRMTPDQMVAEVRKCAELGGTPIEGAISTAFGCTLQGEVPEKEVVRLAVALAEFCDSVALADTVGYAIPPRSEDCSLSSGKKSVTSWKARISTIRAAWPRQRARRLRGSVRHFDSSLGGLGAVPSRRAPAATSSPRTWCSCSRAWGFDRRRFRCAAEGARSPGRGNSRRADLRAHPARRPA